MRCEHKDCSVWVLDNLSEDVLETGTARRRNPKKQNHRQWTARNAKESDQLGHFVQLFGQKSEPLFQRWGSGAVPGAALRELGAQALRVLTEYSDYIVAHNSLFTVSAS